MRATWLTLAAVTLALGAGCKKKAQPAPVTAPTVPPPPSTNYDPNAGALLNAVHAGKRAMTLAQFHGLGQLIQAEWAGNGFKMPGVAVIKEQVKKGDPKLYEAIEDGSVVLCWTAEHEGVWAYQAGAKEHGGLAIVTGTARQISADELKQLLAQP